MSYTYTYTYTRLDLYNYYDDLMVCGIVTSLTVTTSLRSVIDTPVASNMVINLWAFTPQQRLRTMMVMMYYISRYVYIYIYIYIYSYYSMSLNYNMRETKYNKRERERESY